MPTTYYILIEETMKLPFTKMHGLGNDFVVLDFTQARVPLSRDQIQHIANRHLGIGCDQILIVEQSNKPDIDFRYRIVNADGSEVGQCGNGSRCFAKFVYDTGLSDKNPLVIETSSGVLTVFTDSQTGLVTVDMGVPQFNPRAVPILSEHTQTHYTLSLSEYNVPPQYAQIECAAVSMGNPHCVIQVEELNNAVVETLGPILESHPFFPEKCNVGFMQIIDKHNFALRVYERGVGETQACGSGACAAAAVAIRDGLVENTVAAHLSEGVLQLTWPQKDMSLRMTGPAETAFTGEIEL